MWWLLWTCGSRSKKGDAAFGEGWLLQGVIEWTAALAVGYTPPLRAHSWEALHMRVRSLLLECSALSLVLWVSPCFAQQATVSESLEQTPVRVPPRGTLVRPQDGVQHPALNEAWEQYDLTVESVGNALRAVISDRFDAAAASGDLASAEKWENALYRFDEEGETPKELVAQESVAASLETLKQAQNDLGKAYDALIVKLTMNKALDDARLVRSEKDDVVKSAATHLAKPRPNKKPNSPKSLPQSIVFDFTKPNTLQDFRIAGPWVPNKDGLEFTGTAYARADSNAVFTFPMRVTFLAATFPDKNFDCYVGLFVPSVDNDGESFGATGIHLHWGCFFNKRTLLYVFGRQIEIRHRPLVAGRLNAITLDVNANRLLSVLVNGEEIHREQLPPHLRLEGVIRCNGGGGHVIYRSATVVVEKKQ